MGAKKEKILLILAGLGLALYGLWTGLGKKGERNIEHLSGFPAQEFVEEKTADSSHRGEEEASSSTSSIYVHVEGAVKNPGVYEFQEGARVKDAIEEAGGLTPGGDTASLNLALRLSDEMKIHVPKEGEEVESAEVNLTSSGGGSGGKTRKININRASMEELTTLPSVGESRAREIISYRDHSPFVKPEDIMNVSGIGQKTFDKMKDLISVK